MTTAKALILTGVVLATIIFVVFGLRAVKKNEKKSFGDNRIAEEQKTYTFKEIVNSIINQPVKA